jgi:hypothetical protein
MPTKLFKKLEFIYLEEGAEGCIVNIEAEPVGIAALVRLTTEIGQEGRGGFNRRGATAANRERLP